LKGGEERNRKKRKKRSDISKEKRTTLFLPK